MCATEKYEINADLFARRTGSTDDTGNGPA
jgi:hypothetical protein